MRVAVYCRVSTDEQAEQNISIPAQQSRITSYCHAKNWQVVEYYIDDGFSGKDLERPAMQKLIADAANGKFDIVAVWKLDRISRRQQHVLYLIEDVFNSHSIGFSSVTENIDTSTPAGRAMIGVLAVFAQLERETIIERSKLGKKEAAKQGRFGGGLPYGYDYNKETKQLIINPIQAEAVKLIFEYYLTGKYGFNSIAQMLTEKGFTGQRTSHMQKDQVKNVLSSPFVAGYVKHLDDIYPGKHEPIIDKEIWNQVQKMLQERYTPIPVKDENNLLTGFIYCGKCGCRMRFKSRVWTSKNAAGNNYYYVCYGRAGFKTMSEHYCPSPFYSAEKINAAVIKKITEYSLDPSALENYVSSLQPVNFGGNMKSIQSELSKIDSQMERWLDAFEKEVIDAVTLSERIRKLNERKAKLENSLNEYNEKLQAYDSKVIRANDLLGFIRELPSQWDELTLEEKRGVIANTVESVTVFSNDDVAVKLAI